MENSYGEGGWKRTFLSSSISMNTDKALWKYMTCLKGYPTTLTYHRAIMKNHIQDASNRKFSLIYFLHISLLVVKRYMFLLFLRPLHGLTPLLTNNSLARKEQVPLYLRRTRSAKGSFCSDQNSHVFTSSQYLYSKCVLAIVVSLCTLIGNLPLGYLISWTSEFLSTTADEMMTAWQRLI